MPRLLALLALLALPLAGCLGTEEPPAALDAGEAASDEPLLQPPEPGEAAPAGAPAAAPPRQVDVSFRGTTGHWACLPSGPNSCSGYGLGDGEGAVHEIMEANLTAVQGTLTWTAATPATATLGVWAAAMTSCGEGCWEGTEIGGAEGTSPLAVDLQDVDLGPGEIVMLHVYYVEPADPPVVMGWSLGQAFSFEGQATVG